MTRERNILKRPSLISPMESENLVHDEKSIAMAIDAFCQLGSDGGLGKGRIWILLEKRQRNDEHSMVALDKKSE